MSRIAALLGWELRLQARQGIDLAAGVVLITWLAVLSQLPARTQDLLLPFAIFMDVSVFGLYFMAGMLFLEKGDRVLQALVVTPLPRPGYLATKLLSLMLVSLVVTLLLTLLLHGATGVNWVLLLLGTGLNAWLMVLAGFILAARYDAINEFIVPSIIFLAPSQLPLLGYFGIWESWLLYLVPTQPAMLLIEGAFNPLATWQLVYALVYLPFCCVVATVWALRVFDRFVVSAQGGEG